MPAAGKSKQSNMFPWSPLFVVTFCAAFFYVFMEWLFLVTKPSFMDTLGLGRQVGILLSMGSLAAGVCITLLLPGMVLGLLPQLRARNRQLIRIGAALPAVLFATTALILVDNFTYTIFGFGVVSSSGLGRAAYLLGFLALIAISYRQVVLPFLTALDARFSRGLVSLRAFEGLMVFILLCLAGMVIAKPDYSSVDLQVDVTSIKERYNIIYITADGLNADHMSAYGYERDTTPNIRKLAESSLLAENHFSNAGMTLGSITAVFTSNYPLTTGVVAQPHTLKGEDSYLHLPRILKQAGYTSIQLGVPNLVDSNAIRLQGGFDSVNDRQMSEGNWLSSEINDLFDEDVSFITDYLFERTYTRLRHIFFIEAMERPIEVDNNSQEYASGDRTKVAKLVELFENTSQPIFVHAHFMGTHGPFFTPARQHFSAGKEIIGQEEWNPDLYDDAILEFDLHIGDILQALSHQDLLDNTILIIGGDHGQQWDALTRIPLIIRFPKGQQAGHISVNTQNIDIAPTITDYLGLGVPGWMAG